MESQKLAHANVTPVLLFVLQHEVLQQRLVDEPAMQASRDIRPKCMDKGQLFLLYSKSC